MKSFCLKTNNQEIINYLLKRLENSSIEDIYFINKKFKCYQNVIVHYKGTNLYSFLGILSDILTDCILLFFEPILIKRIITCEYFYFDELEKKLIENNCYEYILSEENSTLKYRKNEIWTSVISYINENKSVIIDGFVSFRLENYSKTLDEIVDFCVKEYVIEKEYNEFINLLQIYINSKQPISSLIHLVYTNGESILLDENKNIINLQNSNFDAKYLSDISFSSNDYALNALLTLLPKKIELHLISYSDEFVDTLKLIFGDKLSICTDCNICRTYQVLNNVNLKNILDTN